MFRRVEALPVQPELMVQRVSRERPCEPGFIGPIKRQRLSLKWRKKAVRAVMIGSGLPCSVDAPGNVPNTKEERLPRTVRESTGRTSLEAHVGAETSIAEGANRKPDAIVQVDHTGNAKRCAEDRFPFTKRDF